jgi:inhibitor of cysteine peptidase
MRKSVRFLLPVLFALLLVLTACGGGGQKADVVVDESQNGGSVTLKTGQILEVRLSSDPETGKRWEVISVDPAVLEQAGDPRFEEGTDQNPAPAGMRGWGVFQFKAVAPGQTVLEMVYQVPDSGAPERNFVLQVTVE